MDLKKLFTNMAILGLFTFSLMAFILTTQNENDVQTPITNNTYINSSYGDLYDKLSDSKSSAEEASGNFANTTPTQEYGELEITSIVSPTTITKTILLGFYNIFIKLPQVILGVPSVVASLISAIIAVFIIIGIWAIWKGVVT
jgi:hypothetical protein